MNQLATESAAAPSLMKPMLLWLVVQLVALGMGAGGLPLSAKRINPPEALSIHVMAVTQVAAAAFIWPILMANWRSSVAVIFTSFPFLFASSFLSAATSYQTFAVGGMTFVWLLTLAVLPRAKNDPIWMVTTRALVILWCIGGAILTYLRAVFSSAPAPFALGPIVQILSALQGENVHWYFSMDAALLFCTIGLSLIFKMLRAKHATAI